MLGYLHATNDDILLSLSRLGTGLYALAGMSYFGVRATGRRDTYRLVSRPILTFGFAAYAVLFMLVGQVLATDGSLFVHAWFRAAYNNALLWPGVTGLVTMWFAEHTIRETFCRAKDAADRVRNIKVGS